MSRLRNYLKKGRLEAGCDEAGRGCLAGPVFAAAVILPPRFSHPLLNDSKKISAAQRNTLRPVIEKKAVAWAVGIATVEEIDTLNILNASILAMHRAIAKLEQPPQFLLIDGNRFKPYGEMEHSCEIKGDGRFKSIAAASILAKTHRDEFMQSLHNAYPHYQWHKNQGYPTAAHRAAIEKYGPCPHHRRSFQLLAKQTKLKLS